MKQHLKPALTILVLIAWLAIPQDKLILFLVEHVFTITNLVIGLLAYMVYVQYLEIKERASRRRMKDFTYRDFDKPEISDWFRERIKR